MMEFKLPDLGEGVHEGQIIAVHVQEGQSIHEDELLLEIETDKAAVEIPSPCTGTVTTVHIKDKQLVHVGDVMVTFDTEVTSEIPTNQDMPKKTKICQRKPPRSLPINTFRLRRFVPRHLYESTLDQLVLIFQL